MRTLDLGEGKMGGCRSGGRWHRRRSTLGSQECNILLCNIFLHDGVKDK
jgi:hypothetical protein